MPPTDRFVISFAAEPPQEALPYGRWADTLRTYFMSACEDIDTEGEQLGDVGEIAWFPDRTYGGRTYVPAVARTTAGFELFGFVSWKLDLNDDVIGNWRGEEGKIAEMTLVWGVPLIPGGAVVTAELANLAVDQCGLIEERFTLIAPDNYRSDYLEVKLWGKRGHELARESLYEDDDEEETDEDDDASLDGNGVEGANSDGGDAAGGAGRS